MININHEENMRYTELIERKIFFSGKPIEVTIDPKASATCKLVDVDVPALDAAFSKETDFYVGPGGSGGIGKRYVRFADFIANSNTVEASMVYVDEIGRVSFDNGRHRFAFFRDNGIKTMPVSMTPESITNATKFGYIK